MDLVERAQLEDKLQRSRKTGEPLTIKAGFDPSAPDLHLGHSVLLEKMRHATERALEEDRISYEDSARLLRTYEEGLAAYTYLT